MNNYIIQIFLLLGNIISAASVSIIFAFFIAVLFSLGSGTGYFICSLFRSNSLGKNKNDIFENSKQIAHKIFKVVWICGSFFVPVMFIFGKIFLLLFPGLKDINNTDFFIEAAILYLSTVVALSHGISNKIKLKTVLYVVVCFIISYCMYLLYYYINNAIAIFAPFLLGLIIECCIWKLDIIMKVSHKETCSTELN